MSTDSADTQRLLEAAQAGDELALAALFDQHRPRRERMVRLRLDRRLQPRVDPADVVQEAYLEVRQKFAQYRTESGLPLFLWLRRADQFMAAFRQGQRPSWRTTPDASPNIRT
ncbi:MAG: hypothetical protein L0Z62_05725 [Gemmataceae bacterium]|nr:hypothetical protein [Gemmataceae bacterium]